MCPWEILDKTLRLVFRGSLNNIDISALENKAYKLVRKGILERFIVQKPN